MAVSQITASLSQDKPTTAELRLAFLRDADIGLNHIDGLLKALSALTIEVPKDEREDRFDAADAVLMSTQWLVSHLIEQLPLAINPERS